MMTLATATTALVVTLAGDGSVSECGRLSQPSQLVDALQYSLTYLLWLWLLLLLCWLLLLTVLFNVSISVVTAG